MTKQEPKRTSFDRRLERKAHKATIQQAQEEKKKRRKEGRRTK